MSFSRVDVERAFTEEVELAGHIIDSLLLPKVLDEIMSQGGRFEILKIAVGQRRQDPSACRLLVSVDSEEKLDHIVNEIGKHGAVRVDAHDAQLVAADMDGAFPEGFYCSTNQETQVRVGGIWHRVERPEMDCGLVVQDDRLAGGVSPSVLTTSCENPTTGGLTPPASRHRYFCGFI